MLKDTVLLRMLLELSSTGLANFDNMLLHVTDVIGCLTPLPGNSCQLCNHVQLLGCCTQGQTPLAHAAQHTRESYARLDLVEVLLAAGALPHGTGPQVSINADIAVRLITHA